MRISVDVGGTFTDVILLDEKTSRLRLEKVETTPQNPASGVLQGLEKIGAKLPEVDYFVHGTTLGANALLTRTGARVAIVTTKGFRDVYELGRTDREPMYDLRYRKPKTLVPRYLVFEIEERMDFQGEVLTPFNREEASEVARRIREQRVEAVAVCFLHSYANPDHELAMGEILRRDHPEAVVTLRCRTPGTFDYICLVHGPLMTGTITVSAALPSVGGFAPTLLMGVMAGLIGLGMVAGGGLLVARRVRTI